MKKDRTENEILAQIKQTLNTYQEDYIPGSWEGYLQRGKAKKRKLYLQIVSGIAACLLIGFLGFEFFYQDKHDLLRLTAEKKDIPVTKKSAEPQTTHEAILSSPVVTPAVSRVAVVPGKKTFKPAVALFVADSAARRNSISSSQTMVAENQVAANSSKPAERAVLVSNNKTDSLKISRDTVRSQTTIMAPDVLQASDKQNIAESRKRKVRFGINFSPGVSTAKSSSSFNFTGGVSADIALFSNFQLTTGLQVENQNILQKTPGMVSMADASLSFANSYSAPLIENRTKMINLDVPVNITWKFFSEKTNAYYVSAGLSSLVYLRQANKNTTYSQSLVPVSSVVAGTEVKSYTVVDQVAVSENSGAPGQTFDFAGRVNIMVGYEKKLSNKLFIHVEPYAKIPASGLAPGSLNHTSTGVNFKISF